MGHTMSKRKRKGRSRKGSAQGSAALQRNGLRAFQQADYDRAIDAWERVAQRTPERTPAAALAEAHFRRGLARMHDAGPQASLPDLQQATELQPEDPCYAHHLGLAAFRSGDLDRAVRCFAVARRGDTGVAARAAYPLALALRQRGDDPSAHPVWSALSDDEQAMLRAADAFRHRPYNLHPEAPALWHGIAALDEGDGQGAYDVFQGVVGGGSALEKSVAHYYLGVLAADAARWEDAARSWNAARAAGYTSPWLLENAGELYHRLAEERLQEGDVEGALNAAQEAHRLKPGDNRLEKLLSQVYEREG
jgi:tetratricopeptide (TPR) repeat protein